MSSLLLVIGLFGGLFLAVYVTIKLFPVDIEFDSYRSNRVLNTPVARSSHKPPRWV